MSDVVKLTRFPDGRAAVLTINNPGRANALSHSVIDRLLATVRGLPDECSALVIAGSGRVFSGGADLNCVRGKCGDDRSVQEMLDELAAAIEAAPFPVVALIDAPCIGAAVEMVLACDARIGTAAAEFRIPATAIGVVYRSQGVENLRRRLPFAALQSMLLLGNTIGAERAQAWGVIDLADSGEHAWSMVGQLLDRVVPRAETFAAQKKSIAVAVRAVGLTDEDHRQITDIRNEIKGRQAMKAEG